MGDRTAKEEMSLKLEPVKFLLVPSPQSFSSSLSFVRMRHGPLNQIVSPLLSVPLPLLAGPLVKTGQEERPQAREQSSDEVELAPFEIPSL